MTTSPTVRSRSRATVGSDSRSERRSWTAGLRAVLDRPQTSYQIVLGVTALLLALGLMMVLSASSVLSLRTTGSAYSIFKRQLIWVAIALPMALLATRMKIRHFRALSWVALLGSMVLIALTYTPMGVYVNGNTNWLQLAPGIQIQPSEFAKLALVMWCADIFARKQKVLNQWKHLLVPMLPVSMLVVAMVLHQHDLGTALVIMTLILGLVFVVGAPVRVFVALITLAGAVATFFVITEKNRLDRVTQFLDPFHDPQAAGWQAYHSFYAFSTGGWWGVGIGASRQKWGNLPEAHTDFIFSVIGEELGLFGTLVVLGLYLMLGYAGVRIATRHAEPFARYAAAGITIWLMAQTLVNLGAVLGLLPIIGIPLPLLSYGGSALLPTLLAIGMLVSFARSEPGAKIALAKAGEQRRRDRRLRLLPRRGA